MMFQFHPPPPDAIEFQQPGFRACKIETGDGRRDIVLSGFFQSEKFLDRAVVLPLFKAAEGKRKELMSKYRSALESHEITAIHVRRGDYLRNPTRHPFVGRRYLLQAVRKMRQIKGDSLADFLVLSDDLPWCRAFFSGRRFRGLRFHFSENRSALDDLYLASLCKNNIVSNSSFGWWGAWLNESEDKTVIAPSYWFGEDLKRDGVDWKDIYTKDMVVINNDYGFCRRFWASCVKSEWNMVARALRGLKILGLRQ